jgi:hypothetical protein
MPWSSFLSSVVRDDNVYDLVCEVSLLLNMFRMNPGYQG